MTDSLKFAGIVLCGGRSTRMGTPKEWLDLDGEPMLNRIVRVVGEVTQPVIVAARPNQSLPRLPEIVEIACDSISDIGPLAGIEAALSRLEGRSDAAFITACDHPLLQPAFICSLIELLGDASGVVLVQDGHIRPLPGIYHLRTLPLLRELISQGERGVTVFAEQCGAVRVAVEELPDVAVHLDSLLNLNGPPRYAEVQRRGSASSDIPRSSK